MKGYIVAVIAFAFFIVCPRMAGMTYIISKNVNIGLFKIVLAGTLVSIPLVLAMTWVFSRYGIGMALAFAVITDVVAALLMGQLSLKAGFETIVIALFLIAGVKIASLLSSRLF